MFAMGADWVPLDRCAQRGKVVRYCSLEIRNGPGVFRLRLSPGPSCSLASLGGSDLVARFARYCWRMGTIAPVQSRVELYCFFC